MTKITLLIFLLMLSVGLLAQDCLVHTGTYQGKNVYMQNPFANDGFGFCVKDVKVNGNAISCDISNSAFMIDFQKLELEIGDSISIHIYHDEQDHPKILNPGALTPRSECKFKSINLEQDSILSWCTIGETSRINFIIEQFRWNKWIKLGEIMGNGTISNNCYEFIADVHSGKNVIRIRQENDKTDFIEVQNTGNKPKVALMNSKGNAVELSAKTMYEMFNTNGTLVLKGYGKLIPCDILEPGLYYINYDNTAGDVWNKTFY